jgi:hypothetical protein
MDLATWQDFGAKQKMSSPDRVTKYKSDILRLSKNVICRYDYMYSSLHVN